MINVLIYIESRFPADRVKIRKFTENYLTKRLSRDCEVGINIVGDRKIRSLNQEYRKISEPTDVLSFPIDDISVSSRQDLQVGFSPDISSPDNIMRLGDVVISYPQAVREASEDNLLVDQKIEALIIHGLDHLMGIHHE